MQRAIPYKIAIILIFAFHAKALIDLELIKQYIDHTPFSYTEIHTCDMQQASYKLYRNSENAIPATHIIINNFNSSLSYITSENNKMKIFGISHTGIFIDGDCQDSNQLVYELAELRLCTSKNPCLIMYGDIQERKKLHNNFSSLKLNIDASLNIAQRIDEKNGIYQILDLYKILARLQTQLVIRQLGHWNKITGFNFPQNLTGKYIVRQNWNGIRFRTITVFPMPYKGTPEEHVRSDENIQDNHFNRMTCMLMMYCGEFFNFTMDIEYRASWGYMMPNGTFDGMVGALQSNDIEFGCAPLFLLLDRLRVADYGFIVWRLKTAFVFRHPKVKTTFEVFLRPMDQFIWFLLLIAVAVIMLVMKCIIYYEYRRVEEDIDISWSGIALFLIGALCQQGTPRVPSFISGRILTIFVFVFTVLIFQYYSGSLVSSLLLQPPVTIKSVYDLANSDLHVGSESVIYARRYFRLISGDPTLKKLQTMSPPNKEFFMEIEEGFKLVQQGGFAFNVDLATAYPFVKKNFSQDIICDLEEVYVYDERPIYSNFAKGSSFRKPFTIVYQKVGERGLLQRLLNKYQARRPSCIKSMVVASVVGLSEFYPALVILCFGMLMSLVILSLECILFKLTEWKRNNFNKSTSTTLVQPYIN